MYGTGADPNIITLGPKVGGHPNSTPYTYKTSLNFQQVKHGAPLLAPIDMVFIGFKNRNAKYRIKLIDGNSANQLPDGQNKVYITPFNDLELCFESSSPDWPGMIICTYHLSTSPLLLGHNQNPDCGEVEEWGSTVQVQGHIFYAVDDYSQENGNARSCEALIGQIRCCRKNDVFHTGFVWKSSRWTSGYCRSYRYHTRCCYRDYWCISSIAWAIVRSNHVEAGV